MSEAIVHSLIPSHHGSTSISSTSLNQESNSPSISTLVNDKESSSVTDNDLSITELPHVASTDISPSNEENKVDCSTSQSNNLQKSSLESNSVDSIENASEISPLLTTISSPASSTTSVSNVTNSHGDTVAAAATLTADSCSIMSSTVIDERSKSGTDCQESQISSSSADVHCGSESSSGLVVTCPKDVVAASKSHGYLLVYGFGRNSLGRFSLVGSYYEPNGK